MNRFAKDWYNTSYSLQGFGAQRRYPNEELLRFLGRNYFSLPHTERQKVKVLEIGCGSCANLWMISREGFDTYGLDISEISLDLGRKMLEYWGGTAHLIAANMTAIPYPDCSFDVVVDIFSSNCLDVASFHSYIEQVWAKLKTGGRFFLFTPTTESDAFKDYAPSTKIDDFTLDGIHRKNSPYVGNHYPFRFSDISWLKEKLERVGFKVTYCETVTRSYSGRSELFQQVSLESIKN